VAATSWVRKARQFSLPLPFLWFHSQKEPIGEIFEAKVTNDGFRIKARVSRIEEPGRLKDRVDEAGQSIKAKLVRGLSIGWSPVEAEPIKGTSYVRFTKWLWAELSAKTRLGAALGDRAVGSARVHLRSDGASSRP
jgi:hypothetical protein